MKVVDEAVVIKETVDGSFYVMFGGVVVGWHLSRPAAERNRNEFVKELETFLSPLFPLVKKIWGAVEHDHLQSLEAHDAYQEAKTLLGQS